MFGLLNRRSLMVATLAAAIGIPYVANDPAWRAKATSLWNSLTATTATNDPFDTSLDWRNVRNDTGAPLDPKATPNPAVQPDAVGLPNTLEGPPVQNFGEVLRFDATPRWITSRWSRVTTVLSEYNLEGLRVPFVSGTRLDDVSGALTYYYDKQYRLQRITLEGLTGDERRLAAYLQQAFGLKPEPSLYAGLLMSKWNGKPKSAMVVRHAPVVSSATPHMRLEVVIEINRPDDYYQLSDPFKHSLDTGRKTSRWGT